MYMPFLFQICVEKICVEKNDKYEGCPEVAVVVIVLQAVIARWRAGVCIASCP